ncbi:MAG: response regulator, partial [Bacteroidota bacterium]
MLKFLVIEDDASIRELLKRLLKKKFECAVFEAENGQAGLQVLEQTVPNFVLLDITMPVMDGIETLEKIRANHKFKKIPVMVLTAMSDKKVVGNLAKLGISDYLLKPIDTEITYERIKKFIMKFDDTPKNGIDEKKERVHNEKSPSQILIVDKNTNFKEFFSSLLSGKFVVHYASSGMKGLEIFSAHRPEFILVSDELGLLDKKILTQKIREFASTNEVS